jgi:hypothetical protein
MKGFKHKRHLVSVNEATQILGLSHWTLRGWANRGMVASHRLSTRLMFDRDEIDRVIRETERPSLANRRQPKTSERLSGEISKWRER